MHLILASASLRRQNILKKEGYDFKIAVSDFTEVAFSGDPLSTVLSNAVGKAEDVYRKLGDRTAVVLGADTVVVLNGKIIGKPKDSLDAEKTLRLLSGNTHSVYTGFAVVSDLGTIKDYAVSNVTFPVLSKETIKEYVKSGKPLDKAGSYGLQDGFITVKEFTGSRENIIGLPIEKVKPIIDELLKK